MDLNEDFGVFFLYLFFGKKGGLFEFFYMNVWRWWWRKGRKNKKKMKKKML